MRFSKFAFTLLLLLMVSDLSFAALQSGRDNNTDNEFINAKVVEITDTRIAVIAETGVEHVIAVDANRTKVTADGFPVSVRELRIGDIVSVKLDAANRVMFAQAIQLDPGRSKLASNRR
jgi:hypothetical protein